MLSAGFLIVKPVVRSAYFSAELIPDEVISASNCICPLFPGPYAISWCSTPDEARDLLLAVGVPAELHPAAIEWATAVFDDVFGWPGVFYTVEGARAARERFLSTSSAKVIGLGLPEELAADFITATTPPVSPPGFAPNGESGYRKCVRSGAPLPPGGRVLGFEPLNVPAPTLSLEDSWLCNGLEKHCATVLGIRSGPNGLLTSLDDAMRCCGEIGREEVGAEPGPWYPFLLVEY